MIKTTGLPPSPCRSCGKVNDAGAWNERHGKPGLGPGDISLCWYCGEIGILDEDRKLRKLTPAELIQLQGSDIWLLIERYHAGIVARLQARAR
jgi:hypothetical protein